MWRLVCPLIVVAGCWSDEPLVDGELSGAQLAALRDEMRLRDLEPCAGLPPNVHCDAAARLGQEMFFEPALSTTGTVACVTCHDPNGWFIDTRMPNNLSLGVAKYTTRNSPATLDLGLIASLAPGDHGVFTWNGSDKFTSSGAVMELALTKPMGWKTDEAITNLVANLVLYNDYYRTEYMKAFGAPDSAGDILPNAELAMTAYLNRVSTGYSAFDNYIAGDDTALFDNEKRGFGVFVGRGTCISCHSGPALSDLDFHNTGVAQSGAMVDNGRFEVTGKASDIGRFRTPSLRNVARTKPYMHDGSLASLDDVIAFYRRGGDASAYPGTKDPRIQPLEISDQDADDLTAFLQKLDGMNVPAELTVDPRPFKLLCGQLQLCTGRCFDTQTDFLNCGGCGIECNIGQTCAAGRCVDACGSGSGSGGGSGSCG